MIDRLTHLLEDVREHLGEIDADEGEGVGGGGVGFLGGEHGPRPALVGAAHVGEGAEREAAHLLHVHGHVVFRETRLRAPLGTLPDEGAARRLL